MLSKVQPADYPTRESDGMLIYTRLQVCGVSNFQSLKELHSDRQWLVEHAKKILSLPQTLLTCVSSQLKCGCLSNKAWRGSALYRLGWAYLAAKGASDWPQPFGIWALRGGAANASRSLWRNSASFLNRPSSYSFSLCHSVCTLLSSMGTGLTSGNAGLSRGTRSGCICLLSTRILLSCGWRCRSSGCRILSSGCMRLSSTGGLFTRCMRRSSGWITLADGSILNRLWSCKASWGSMILQE